MKIFKNLWIICIANLLLISCSSNVQSTATISKQNEFSIEDLADGNYHYCSDPNLYPYEDKVDVHRYCFTFTKVGVEVIGEYLYRAPKDTPYICIEGKVNNDQVTGVGYEGIGPGSQPYTEEDFSDFEELPSSEQLRYWDDVEHYQGGLNLKVGNPSLYKLSPAIENGHGSYWATQRYGIIEFDLSDFEQIEVNSLPEFTKCTN